MTTPLTPEEEAEALLGAMIAAQRHFGRLGKVPLSFVAQMLSGLRERRERVDPDLLARVEALRVKTEGGEYDMGWNAALAAILAATEAPREPNMDYERRDAILDVVRRAYPATPDHTEVGEEREMPPLDAGGTVAATLEAGAQRQREAELDVPDWQRELRASRFLCGDCGHHLHRPGPCQWGGCLCSRATPRPR